MRAAAAAICLALTLAGCGIGRREPATGPEFVGRSMRVEASSGVTRLTFRRDGTVEARFGRQRTQGRWALARRQLCFTWARNYRECWPYRAPFQRGRTVPIRSDRGNQVRVTLL